MENKKTIADSSARGENKSFVSRRSFLLDWALKEDRLTSYNMHPMVIRYGETFYSKGVDERTYIKNLVANLNKLVKEKILRKPQCVGLGQDAKNDFFWNHSTILLACVGMLEVVTEWRLTFCQLCVRAGI